MSHLDVITLCALRYEKIYRGFVKFSLDPPSVGSTEIEMVLYHTLEPCDVRFVNSHSEQKLSIK